MKRCPKCKNWTISTTSFCLNCEAEMFGDFSRTKEDENIDFMPESANLGNESYSGISSISKDKIRACIVERLSDLKHPKNGLYHSPLSNYVDKKFRNNLEVRGSDIILAIELQSEITNFNKHKCGLVFTSEGFHWAAITEVGDSDNSRTCHYKGFLPYLAFPYINIDSSVEFYKPTDMEREHVYGSVSIDKLFEYKEGTKYLDGIAGFDGADKIRIRFRRLLSFKDSYAVSRVPVVHESNETMFMVSLSQLFTFIRIDIETILATNAEELYQKMKALKVKTENYSCGDYANRALALRYGIVNNNSDSIRIKKLSDVEVNSKGICCLAELPDFNDRKVSVMLANDSKKVITFYPLSEGWFEKYSDVEEVLEGNDAFELKELAKIHMQLLVEAKKYQL